MRLELRVEFDQFVQGAPHRSQFSQDCMVAFIEPLVHVAGHAMEPFGIGQLSPRSPELDILTCDRRGGVYLGQLKLRELASVGCRARCGFEPLEFSARVLPGIERVTGRISLFDQFAEMIE